MPDTSSPESSSTRTTEPEAALHTRPSECIPQGRYPTRAYGILMDWEHICRWLPTRLRRRPIALAAQGARPGDHAHTRARLDDLLTHMLPLPLRVYWYSVVPGPCSWAAPPESCDAPVARS